MRVLVAGGAGFIGFHLCERLLADGREVTAIDDLSTGMLENLAATLELIVDFDRSRPVAD